MSMDTWTNMIKLMRKVSPRTRLEIANAGEPTLHPNLLEMLVVAKTLL
jgi:wyosine [tRNA(Phe)-imidazoG37] synthetase (radical SAM superfamily)